MSTRIASRGTESNTVAHADAPQGPEAANSEILDIPTTALSIQNQVARLNMVQAHASKHAATEKLGEVQQARAQLLALQKVIALAEKITHGGFTAPLQEVNNWQSEPTTELEKILKYLRDKKFIALLFMPDRLNPNEVLISLDKEHGDVLMRQLSGEKEEINAKMQSAMTQLQDFMAQYQSFVDGARTASSKANELTMKLAR